jgi:hypothetical protein
MIKRIATPLFSLLLGVGCYAEAQFVPMAPNAVAADGTVVANAPSGDVAIGVATDEYSDADPSALSEFRTTLDPHGDWVDDPSYGTVWVPHTAVVGADFVPYSTAGHWVYDTDYVWVSDYSWGWAPFHYGRWVRTSHRGWAWIPGRVYRGAWVEWRTGPVGYGYVGWAPLAPSWYWYGGAAVAFATPPTTSYVFVSNTNVFHVAPSTCVIRDSGPHYAATRVRAQPTVSTNRIPGQPSVASNGNGYSPGGSFGPPPSSLGIEERSVPRLTAEHRGVAEARSRAIPTRERPVTTYAGYTGSPQPSATATTPLVPTTQAATPATNSFFGVNPRTSYQGATTQGSSATNPAVGSREVGQRELAQRPTRTITGYGSQPNASSGFSAPTQRFESGSPNIPAARSELAPNYARTNDVPRGPSLEPRATPRVETMRTETPRFEASRPALAPAPRIEAPRFESRPTPAPTPRFEAARPSVPAPRVEVARPSAPTPRFETARPSAPAPRVEVARPAAPIAAPRVEAARPSVAPAPRPVAPAAASPAVVRRRR